MMFDAIVVGGGFYGAVIAIYLSEHRGFKRVALIERESGLMLRASHNNQARVHNGYHYPRSFITAFRSRVNLPRFVHDWPQVVKTDFTKLYAIARQNSKVNARQFERFCREIGAKLEAPPAATRNLFDAKLIQAVYQVEEYAFDAVELARWAVDKLQECGVAVYANSRVKSIVRGASAWQVESDGELDTSTTARYVFNCTYSGLNQIAGTQGTSTTLKHEITEMALMKMPDTLRQIGITVMDGPFFSAMPFPSRGLHTLSHVRYTPHLHWLDTPDVDPYRRLQEYTRETRVDRMIRDVERYVPAIVDATYVESLFEVKTVLIRNEGDDGRPILFERHGSAEGYYSILGGKIDNIYDVLERLEAEQLQA